MAKTFKYRVELLSISDARSAEARLNECAEKGYRVVLGIPSDVKILVVMEKAPDAGRPTKEELSKQED